MLKYNIANEYFDNLTEFEHLGMARTKKDRIRERIKKKE
jgi:hypothetical protein